LIEDVKRLPRREVADVRVGLGYTGAKLEDGSAGVAHTQRSTASKTCSVIQEAGTFRGKAAQDLVQMVLSPDPLHAAVGLACLNALLAQDLPPCHGGDVLEAVRISKGDEVAMVGHFHPLVAPTKKVAKRLYVLEEKEIDEEGFYPSEKASEILPRCQVALITSVTLLSKTFDDLIPLTRNAREVVLMGPTTPLAPQCFREVGVSLLAGVRVIDPERLLQVISEGGGTRHFGPAVEKVTVKT
jgi:uncharacterized protein (DUF4213/DUF364 family)